jgi:hypothetical protein
MSPLPPITTIFMHGLLSCSPTQGALFDFHHRIDGHSFFFSGVMPEVGPYTQFATTPGQAPVLWPGADGPLSFQFWQLGPLNIGASTDLRVFLGHQGHGRNTFCAVPDTFLPKDVPVRATLFYKDKDGKERRAQSELRERC